MYINYYSDTFNDNMFLFPQLQKRHDLYAVIASIFRPSPDTVVSHYNTCNTFLRLTWFCTHTHSHVIDCLYLISFVVLHI